MNTPLDYFGLRPDADEREVKRAYAGMLKSMRPDEDQDGFQQLHAMYQQALAWVRRGSVSAPTGTPVATQHLAATHLAAAPAFTASTPTPTPDADAMETEAPPEAFQPIAFLHGLLPKLTKNDATDLLAWLNQQPMLWSLEHKRLAGQIALNQLFQDTPPVAGASLDALLQFFGFDQVASGVDPIRLRWLRTEMDEQHVALQRARSAAALGNPLYLSAEGRLVAPWGKDQAQFDPDCFLDWFCAKAPGLSSEDLIMYVRVGLMPLPRAAKHDFARRTMERVLRDAPPLPANCTQLLLKLLLPYAGQVAAQPALRDLAARLQLQWLAQPANTAALHALTCAKQSTRSQATTRRLLRCARRPFAWWRVLLAGLMPLWPSMMGAFLRQLSGGQPARLHEVFDPKTVDFWIAATDRRRLALPRLAVGALRCTVLLLCGLAIGLLSKLAPDSPLSSTAPWDPLTLAAIATGGWGAYLVFLLAFFWQCAPETPRGRYALLRFLFIPAMIAGGLALYYVSDNLVAAQVVLAPLAMLAFLRYRARNALPSGFNKVHPSLRALLYYVGIGVCVQVLRLPALSAGIALMLWLVDASQPGHRPSLKREQRHPARQPSHDL